MPRSRVLFQLIEFLRVEKKYWLMPIVVVIALIGMVMFAQSSAIAPFIYTLF